MFVWLLSLKWKTTKVKKTLQISYRDLICALCYWKQCLSKILEGQEPLTRQLISDTCVRNSNDQPSIRLFQSSKYFWIVSYLKPLENRVCMVTFTKYYPISAPEPAFPLSSRSNGQRTRGRSRRIHSRCDGSRGEALGGPPPLIFRAEGNFLEIAPPPLISGSGWPSPPLLSQGLPSALQLFANFIPVGMKCLK